METWKLRKLTRTSRIYDIKIPMMVSTLSSLTISLAMTTMLTNLLLWFKNFIYIILVSKFLVSRYPKTRKHPETTEYLEIFSPNCWWLHNVLSLKSKIVEIILLVVLVERQSAGESQSLLAASHRIASPPLSPTFRYFITYEGEYNPRSIAGIDRKRGRVVGTELRKNVLFFCFNLAN